MSDPTSAGHGRRSAARTLTARHDGALLAHTKLLCRDERSARALADEVFAEVLDAVRRGVGPRHAWRPHLLATARRTAARWADTGRADLLAPGFTAWLHAIPCPPGLVPCAETALLTAEENSPALQVFQRLPESLQVDLWRDLERPAEPGASWSTTGVPSERQRLFDAYVQFRALHTPRRDCRQLTARLGDAVRRGDPSDRVLTGHLERCPDCARTWAELTAIHSWDRPAILEALLLWTGAQAPAASAPAIPAPRPAMVPAPRPAEGAGPLLPAPGTPPEQPPTTGSRRERPSDRAILLGLVALGLGVLTISAATLAPDAPDPLVPAPVLPAPRTTPPSPSPSPSPSPPPSLPSRPASSPSRAAPPSAPSPGSAAPDPSPSTGSSVPSATGSPSGAHLVNRRTGLCVTAGSGDGAGVRLTACTGDDAQRWQFVSSGGAGLQQIRAAAGGRCLDGTTGGGNRVAVVLRECRADRREQLWNVVPDKNPADFRLAFAPQVAASDYADHLLGPADIWPGPAADGSALVHQPNYYNKADFLFTLAPPTGSP
ncbi:RICIN domain-containing protein [Kitasatospora sp. NPDC094015]|uniref:RICIN domain-containing protein n=1 Tax=Kitasatospora sp. NPDC094015 TaxID=3155205 RepID=UPI003319046C